MTKRIFKNLSGLPNLSIPPERDSTRGMLKVGKVDSGSTAPKETKVYTGDQMVGISIIHKSCLQPVFSQQAAQDAANMRR